MNFVTRLHALLAHASAYQLEQTENMVNAMRLVAEEPYERGPSPFIMAQMNIDEMIRESTSTATFRTDYVELAKLVQLRTKLEEMITTAREFVD